MSAAVDRVRADARHLAARDARFRDALVEPLHVPERGGGFGTLIHLVLGQQVSLEAAAAMFATLQRETGGLTPKRLLALDDDAMRRSGFSRRKADYARGIARAIGSGDLDLAAIDLMPDAEAVTALTALRGIGVWTAECYLLFGLARRDVFPTGDLALQIGWQEMAGLESRPSPPELGEIAAAWAPRRTAAAHLIWTSYLDRRGRSIEAESALDT